MRDNSTPPTRAEVKRKGRDPDLPILEQITNDIIDIDPDKWFSKRYDDIVEAASELPVVLEAINQGLQRASIFEMKHRYDIDALEGETYGRLRQEWSTTYSEKMTEKSLEQIVAQDRDLIQARNNYAVLKSYVSRLANMQINLRAKLDMLRSVEATRRRLISDDIPDNT